MISNMEGDNLVFIAGCPRSGTTYLQRLLAALPTIRTGQESHLFLCIGPLWEKWNILLNNMEKDARGGVGLPCYFSDVEFLNIMRGFLSQLLEPMIGSLKDGEIFVEKTPSNALHMETIHKLLPQARIIYIQRDARDVVTSLLAVYRSWGKLWAPGNAIKAARMWCIYSNHANRAARQLPSSLFYQIKYEDLVAVPDRWLTEISVFLGLNSSKDDIENAVRENSLEKARVTGGTKIPKGPMSPENNSGFVKEPDGFIRRGKPNSWKKDLTLLEKFCVWRVARSTMKRVGYDWKWPW